jgi:hypothetical protein
MLFKILKFYLILLPSLAGKSQKALADGVMNKAQNARIKFSSTNYVTPEWAWKVTGFVFMLLISTIYERK